MNTVAEHIQISPVNMEDRKKVGVQPGDTVRVHQKIQDKGKTRIQIIEGLVLACKHGKEAGATFTVRKVIDGIGVEKIFPLYSPLIDKIEVVKRSKVRRAKLYYIREKVAREIKRQMRRMRLVDIATESGIEVAQRAEEEAKRAEEEAAQQAEEEAKKKEAEAEAQKQEEEAKEVVAEEAPEETKSEEVEVEKEEEKKE